MASQRSSISLLAWRLGAIPILTLIFTAPAPGWPGASERLQNHPRPASNPLSPAQKEKEFLTVPLSFEPNQGQANPEVQFVSRGSGFALFLSPGQMDLRLERLKTGSVDALRMRLAGSNSRASAVGLERQRGVVSYFMGNDPKNWQSAIPTYAKVDYRQIYPGVDLVFYGNQRRLEYDFVVAPGADPTRIAWHVEGARARIDRHGNLVLRTPNGSASFEKPLVYQIDGNRRVPIDGGFVAAGNDVRFRLGAYNHAKELIIDPVLSYATYLAGSNVDYIGLPTGPGILHNGASQGLAVDAAGSAYVAGYTLSADLPTKSGYQNARASKAGAWPSAYVTKFSPDGNSLVFSTYLGGNGTDFAYAIAVDAAGEAYVTGYTSSNNFPITAGAYQAVCSPGPNSKSANVSAAPASCNEANASAFVTKLNASGTGLVYSTFLGGYGWAYTTGIALDGAGRAYVAGVENQYCSTSYLFQGCFPTTSGAVIGGNATGGRSPHYAFMAVFDPAGAKLLYSTLFGDLNGFACPNGCGDAEATGVTVDANGYFYLIGNTKAGKLPTTLGVIQPNGIPLDAVNGVYVTAWRGFVAKFNPVTSGSGASLGWATYLGGRTGNTGDYLSGVTVDNIGNVYVAGYTNSTDFPVTKGAYGTICAPNGGTCSAAHITKLDPSGSSILWSTYVGGSRQDGADSLFYTGPVKLDGKGNVYIIGTANPGFPLVNPVQQPVSGGPGDVVVVELDPAGANLLFSSQVGSGGRNAAGPGGLAVDAAGGIYVGGNILGADLITTPGAFQRTNPAPSCCYHGYVAKIVPSGGPQITVRANSVDVFNAATSQAGGIAPNEFITLKGTGLGPATGVASGMTADLAGSKVYIGGAAAYLTYAQDGQINVLAPFNISGLPSTSIQVEYNGIKGNTVTVPVVAASPGIFTQAYGPGQAWVVNEDQTFNSDSNAASRGTYIVFWLTGQGIVNTTLADGVQPTGPPFPTPMLPVNVKLGGVTVPAGNIAFDGLIYSGELQVNLLIPANAPTGSAVPLIVTIGAAASRSDTTIAIK